MKSYKVKINCPLFTKHDTFKTDELGFIYVNNVAFEPTFYPDIFEEIKEPLFVTEDGKEIFENDKVNTFWVNYRFEIMFEGTFHQNQHPKDYKVFSTKEAAEKWIEDNKPMFSKKQVKEAILKNARFTNYGYIDNDFLKELGL